MRRKFCRLRIVLVKIGSGEVSAILPMRWSLSCSSPVVEQRISQWKSRCHDLHSLSFPGQNGANYRDILKRLNGADWHVEKKQHLMSSYGFHFHHQSAKHLVLYIFWAKMYKEVVMHRVYDSCFCMCASCRVYLFFVFSWKSVCLSKSFFGGMGSHFSFFLC